MPRRSGTDVLFTKWTRPAVFSAGRVLFFGCCFFVPVCGALLLRSVARCCSGLWRAAVPPYAASSSSVCIGRRPRLCRVAALALCRAAVPPCAVSSSSVCIGRRPRLCRVAALALCRAAVPPCAVSSSSVCIGRRPRLCRVAAPICVALSSAVCVVSPSSVCGWPPPENSADGLAGNLCGLRGSCGLSLRCGDSGRVARPLFCSS